ncbi:MAG: hypothetical protein KAJ36_00950 [Candidatus Thorarchaeota archaeon]|nr:hypothetical protein [Candidatus Thorarchaeota archaeon]
MWIGFFIFWGAIILYVFARWGSFFNRSPRDKAAGRTNAEKLYASKVYDASFFDGASEDYTEVMSRLRQYGGA